MTRHKKLTCYRLVNKLASLRKDMTMAHPWHHAISSAKQFGGEAKDYLKIHDWFDQTKAHIPDVRHRAILHSSFGIYLCEQVFGTTIKNSTGRDIPVRKIGEQHVMEDFNGKIPTVQDWLEDLPMKPWMLSAKRVAQDEEDK